MIAKSEQPFGFRAVYLQCFVTWHDAGRHQRLYNHEAVVVICFIGHLVHGLEHRNSIQCSVAAKSITLDHILVGVFDAKDAVANVRIQ